MNKELGAGKIRQESIGETIKINKINQIYLSNLEIFKKLIDETKDVHALELYNQIKNEKKFDFPINKHMEMFILTNQKNIKKIIKYIIFRYKFYLTGKNKINLGYPPYLLIEPVSACNLRCSFCFQIDKSFTRKPYMGVIDFEFFKKVVDQADELQIGAISLASRGEPTMHKKIIEMLEYINQKKNIFELKLNTNGSYLTEKMSHAIFENNVTQIVISSDHYIKEDYERLRLGSNLKENCSKCGMLFNIRKKYYPDSIEINFRVDN